MIQQDVIMLSLSLTIILSIRLMCIAAIIFRASPRFPLIVIHSREEDTSRPTSDLQMDAQGILGARDMHSGGVAAVGMNTRTGDFCTLTNSRCVELIGSEGVSRGMLVGSVLEDMDKARTALHGDGIKYNGGYHLIFGSFLAGTIYYSTNVGGTSSLGTRELTPLVTPAVIVVSNEHPLSECDWTEKKEFIQSELMRHVCSEESTFNSWYDVLVSIEHVLCIERFQRLNSTDESLQKWSPLPVDVERHILEHVLVPAVSVDGGYEFGTVSQTVMILEETAESKQVHYCYRTVKTNGVVAFSGWDTREVVLNNCSENT